MASVLRDSFEISSLHKEKQALEQDYSYCSQ